VCNYAVESRDDAADCNEDSDDDQPGTIVIVQLKEKDPFNWAPALITRRDRRRGTYHVHYYQSEYWPKRCFPAGPWVPWRHDSEPMKIFRECIVLFDVDLNYGFIPRGHLKLVKTKKFDGARFVEEREERVLRLLNKT